MKDLIRIAVVNFHSIWGDIDKNLENIKKYCIKSGEKRVNLILFPETSLCGYDNDKNKPYKEKMHYKTAQTTSDKAVSELIEIAKSYNMFIVFGMNERDTTDFEKIYNSAIVITPNGEVDSYRKIHLPFDEKEWAIAGSEPMLINSEWGSFGVSICYDTYCFPELMRYYRSKGARLILNLTACPDIPPTMNAATLSLKAYACINYSIIASSNLCGKDNTSMFKGGSCIIGPDKVTGWKIYAGKYFGEENSDIEGLYIADINLSDADNNTDIPIFSGDWKKDLYKQWLS